MSENRFSNDDHVKPVWDVAIPDGFYHLSNPGGETCLVRLYTPSHEPPYRGIGYGVWDGGGFLPLWDLCADCTLTPVVITPKPEVVHPLPGVPMKNITLELRHVEEVLTKDILIGSDSAREKKFTFNPWANEYGVYHKGNRVDAGQALEELLQVYNEI